MKRLLLAVVAVAAIGLTASSAQAGGGWGGHHHHHGCGPRVYGGGYVSYYQPPVVYAPYAYPGRVIYPPPYTAYWPQNTFYYQGNNFGMRFGW